MVGEMTMVPTAVVPKTNVVETAGRRILETEGASGCSLQSDKTPVARKVIAGAGQSDATPALARSGEARASECSMGQCYPKCMSEGDDQPARKAWRSAGAMDSTTRKSTRMYATDNQVEDAAALVTKMKTFDLEELGLSVAYQSTQASHQDKSPLVVDYEDSDSEHPVVDDAAQGCGRDACGPLDGSSASASASASEAFVSSQESNVASAGRLTRRRSRRSSSVDAAVALRGKSVMLNEKEAKSVEPVSPSTSATDAEEETTRCSSVHKLCLCEVQLHRSLESCWMVANGQVYDVTGLVGVHPGGSRSILRKAGGPDCTKDMKFHTKKARKMLEKCFIGKLEPCGEVDSAGDANCSIM